MGGNFSAGDRSGTLDNAVSMDADHVGNLLDVNCYQDATIELTWVGADKGNGQIIIQGSLDGVHFDDLPGYSIWMSTANGTHLWEIKTRAFGWLRCAYEAGQNTAGLYTVKYHIEVPA